MLTPLFPLKSVIFPLARMPLQIFEARYLDMIKRCLREGVGFGVVPIKTGEEVGRPGDIFNIGTMVDIVDWNQLSNGLLGITIVGAQVFTVKTSHIEKDNLMVGETIMLPVEAKESMPEEYEYLKALLQNLLDHTVVQKMDMSCDFDDAGDVSWLLSYLLPFSSYKKANLLQVKAPLERLALIVKYLDKMTESLNR